MGKSVIPLKGGDEYDALTRDRKFYFWQSGELRKIKRGYNKRVRREAKQEAKRDSLES